MNIGAVAKASGVPAKTIRYYEGIGLIPPAKRSINGYRDYARSDVEMLRFIHRARGLGFSLPDVERLVGLWQDRSRASADVKALATRHIEEIEQRLRDLEAIRRTLVDLTQRCHGDERPDCPILDDLAGSVATRSGSTEDRP